MRPRGLLGGLGKTFIGFESLSSLGLIRKPVRSPTGDSGQGGLGVSWGLLEAPPAHAALAHHAPLPCSGGPKAHWPLMFRDARVM